MAARTNSSWAPRGPRSRSRPSLRLGLLRPCRRFFPRLEEECSCFRFFQEMPQKPNLEQPISPAGYVAKNLTAWRKFSEREGRFYSKLSREILARCNRT